MIISAIAAIAEDATIGYQQRLPWRLPAEMALFRRLTIGHHVLAGRQTATALKRTLAHRVNLVLSRQPCPQLVAQGFKMYPSLDAAIDFACREGEKELFIIGGEQIYRQSLPQWNRLYLSVVEGQFTGDSFFPLLPHHGQLQQRENRQVLPGWSMQWERTYPSDSENPYPFRHQLWQKEGCNLQKSAT